MTEQLHHYSHAPLHSIRDCEQDGTFKPKGLWVSIRGEYDWRHWCESVGFEDLSLKRLYQIRLAGDARILRISDPFELDLFSERYNGNGRDYSLDWKSVAATYDGIIIAPYIWERRLSRNCNWYYTWDCASGCIWRANAVTSIDLLSDPNVKAESVLATAEEIQK